MSLPRFYPIVDSAAWVARLIGVGARLIQLRIKDWPHADILREAEAAQRICDEAKALLVINDYVDIAIAVGAPYVHLGQEDLDHADVHALRARGIKLGLSTHDEGELARALSFTPDYIALGPIYSTLLKPMRFAPQGLARIGEWKAKIGSIPLVAIGGLDIERAGASLAAGADCVAVVTDITRHADPEARARAWRGAFERD